jgi:hypothetical protein
LPSFAFDPAAFAAPNSLDLSAGRTGGKLDPLKPYRLSRQKLQENNSPRSGMSEFPFAFPLQFANEAALANIAITGRRLKPA